MRVNKVKFERKSSLVLKVNKLVLKQRYWQEINTYRSRLRLGAFPDSSSSMIGWLAALQNLNVDFAHVLFIYIYVKRRTAQTRSYNLTAQVQQTSQVSRASLYLIHPVASLTARNIAMMFEHIYGVASFILMLIVRILLCVFKMSLALTATCREHTGIPLRERYKGRRRKSKQTTERTWSGKKERYRRRKTNRVRSSTSPSATWWTTVSRSKYNIYQFFLWLTWNKGRLSSVSSSIKGGVYEHVLTCK